MKVRAPAWPLEHQRADHAGCYQKGITSASGPFFADNIRWLKLYPRDWATLKEQEVRGERFAASSFAIF